MSKSRFTAPKDMSKTDVLKGLWNCSYPASFFQTIPNGDAVRKEQEVAAWSDKEKIEKDITKRPYVDYFGGRCIKTDISTYPEIDLNKYKTQCEIDMSFQEIIGKCLRKS